MQKVIQQLIPDKKLVLHKNTIWKSNKNIMRITPEQHQSIRKIITEIAGDDAVVILFGSRIDDNKRGGDLDLLIELSHEIDNPAWLIAQLSAKLSRLMAGRKVDVLLSASNLIELPIHKHAKSTGVLL